MPYANSLSSHWENNNSPMLRKVHPIAAIEIEVSPWSYYGETKKGASLLSNQFAFLWTNIGLV